MKRRIILLFLGLTGALSLLWAGVLVAANVRAGDSPTVMANETVDGTLYSGGNIVRIDGTVKGDLICGGQQVTITGTVVGDVLCAAQDLTISGHVEGSVRSAAQTATISGKIDGSTSLVAMTATLSSGATIGKDASIAAQDVTLDGVITRDLQAISRTFTANGSIGRDLDVRATTVNLGDKMIIARNFTYTSDANAAVAGGAHVNGSTYHLLPPVKTTPTVMPAAAYMASLVLGFGSFLVLGIALLGASPRLLVATSQAVTRSPLGTFGMGLVGLLVPPFVAVILFVTIIGIPLALVVLFSWIISMLAAVSVSGHVLGQIIIKKLHWHEAWQNFAALVLGLFIIFLLALVPYLGGYIILAALLWGLGGLWFAAIGQRRVAKSPVTKVSDKK